MTNRRIGDRPNFPLSNQRFDKGDAENIAIYYEQIISRFVGSIYGQTWGFMSAPSFSIRTVPVTGGPNQHFITISKCVLIHSMPADGTDNFQYDDKGPWEATIVQYDPVRAGQPLQELRTNEWFASTPIKRPWMLFRRNETNTNTGNKAYWDTATNTEEIQAAPLQRSEWVEFKLSTSYSSTDRIQGWHRCAYIDSWGGSPGSAASPVIVPVHWMDSLYYNATSPPAQATRVGMTFAHPAAPAASYATGFDPARDMPELGKILHWIAGKIGQHYSTANVRQLQGAEANAVNLKSGAFITVDDSAGGWLSTPPRGLVELDTGLSTVASDIDSLDSEFRAHTVTFENFALRYARTTRLLHTLYVTPVPGANASVWQNYTFDVRATSAQEPISFAPRLGGWYDEDALLRYFFIPQILGGASGRYITLTLGGSTKELAQRYEISAVVITANEAPMIDTAGSWGDLIVSQRYSAPLGQDIVLPPVVLTQSNELSVFFVVQSIEDDAGKARPFTVCIYGRNV